MNRQQNFDNSDKSIDINFSKINTIDDIDKISKKEFIFFMDLIYIQIIENDSYIINEKDKNNFLFVIKNLDIIKDNISFANLDHYFTDGTKRIITSIWQKIKNQDCSYKYYYQKLGVEQKNLIIKIDKIILQTEYVTKKNTYKKDNFVKQMQLSIYNNMRITSDYFVLLELGSKINHFLKLYINIVENEGKENEYHKYGSYKLQLQKTIKQTLDEGMTNGYIFTKHDIVEFKMFLDNIEEETDEMSIIYPKSYEKFYTKYQHKN